MGLDAVRFWKLLGVAMTTIGVDFAPYILAGDAGTAFESLCCMMRESIACFTTFTPAPTDRERLIRRLGSDPGTDADGVPSAVITTVGGGYIG